MIIAVLALILCLLMAYVGNERGVRAFFAIVKNSLVLVASIFLISKGLNVYAVTAVCVALFLIITLYNQNGYNVKTRAAMVSTVAVLAVLSVLLAVLIPMFDIGGFGELYSYEEDIVFLNHRIGIDAYQLWFAAILLGLLGALTDTSLSVSTAVFEVHANAPDRPMEELYQSGIHVGKDIIGTMINTLVHAEFGASFFVWAIFVKQGTSLPQLLNSKSFLQASFLILIADIGCLLVIPLTSAIVSRKLKA